MTDSAFTRDSSGLWLEKAPGATLSYTFGLKAGASPWLATTDTLTAASFAVPTGLTKVQETFTTTSATVKLSGGTAGANYLCTLTWSDSAGNTDSRDFTVRVRRRS